MSKKNLKNLTCPEMEITERREVAERYRFLVEESNDIIWTFNITAMLYTYCSKSVERILGYSQEMASGRTLEDIFSPDVKKKVLSAFGKVVSGASDSDLVLLEAEHRHKDGGSVWMEINAVLHRDGQNQPVSFTGVSRDITERKRAEETMLRQQRAIKVNNRIANVFLTSSSEDLFADILSLILDALESRIGFFGYVDEEGNLSCPSITPEICQIEGKRIVFSKTNWGGIWGRSLMQKKTLIANEGLQLPNWHVPLENVLAVPIIHHEALIGQFVIANKKGGYNAYDQELIESAAKQMAPILNARLKENDQKQAQEKLEKQLRHAQRIEAIGTLAGGIAHDFNNILSSVIGYTELSIDEIQKGTSLHQNLTEVLKAGNRAKDLVKQILTLSRHNVQESMPTFIVPLIRDALKMLRCTIPTSIDFRENICSEQLVVQADPTQIHQIIVNLATNAMHAMEDREGVLEICVESAPLDECRNTDIPDLSAGSYARITVTDTGSGIQDKDLDRIFEPYFTTKNFGEGTGLGLPIVHGIVKSQKGHITVKSELGKGSTFSVYLPLIVGDSSELSVEAVEAVPTGTERILLVDDELPIVNMMQQFLKRLGYRITGKISSTEALKVFRKTPNEFDLVITDMTMPNMTGDKLASLIKELRPSMPVILCTGFSEKVNDQTHMAIDEILTKPIDQLTAAIMIRKVIAEANKRSDSGITGPDVESSVSMFL